MAPTVVKDGAFRRFFFSREEPRMHVHVNHTDGETKFWLEPAIALAQNFGLSARQLGHAEELVKTLVKTHEHLKAWHLAAAWRS